MKPNKWPRKYLTRTNLDETREHMWEVLDGYTFEEVHDNPEKYPNIDMVITLPPLRYRGKVIKGMFYSQGVDAIVKRYPKIKRLFIPIANSMFSSYPASEQADAYFVSYDNKDRMKWYREKHPENNDKILIPLQDSDFLNEYEVAPTFNTPKTIDVFSVMTPYPVKNLPVFAKALILYEKKYGRKLKVTLAIGIRDAIKKPDGTMDYSKIRFDAKEQLDIVTKILGGNAKEYIDFHPFIEHKNISAYYTSAKCCVLTSIIEGKNRFIHEAMSCDTPIVVFNEFNKFSRGDAPIFYGNSGEYAPEFTAESLADTIHKVITNQGKYSARSNFLKHFGRKNFLRTCVDAIPYYKNKLPEYESGKIMDNVWVDLAAIQVFRGLDSFESIINFFYSRFGIS